MRIRPLVLVAVPALVLACGETPPPPPATPPPAHTVESTAATTAAPPATAAPAEPTPEEKKKAEDKKALEKDRAEWKAKHDTEVARWTPELHAEVKKLTDKTFPSGKAAIQAMMASKHREPRNVERDKARHPAETLEFFGFKPNMTVLDVGPGEGWYTELLAPALAKQGKYFGTGGNPNGPEDERPTFYAQRFKQFLETSPEAYGKVEMLVVNGKAPSLGKENTFDMILVMRGVHGMVNNKAWDTWLDEFHKALKPGGVLGIEEHRAKAGANVEEVAKKGYVPQDFVIESAQKHGFKLAGKSEINANAKDTTDHPEGVWTLPPTLKLGDKDREKYVAIGESDRMTLKFVKAPAAAPVTTPGAKPATPATPATPKK